MRFTGKVKWFNEGKGFGFIIVDDGAGDVFVHRNKVNPGSTPLFEGDSVEFDIVRRDKGPSAEKVEKIVDKAEKVGGTSHRTPEFVAKIKRVQSRMREGRRR